jgi:hypothetical protein
VQVLQVQGLLYLPAEPSRRFGQRNLQVDGKSNRDTRLDYAHPHDIVKFVVQADVNHVEADQGTQPGSDLVQQLLQIAMQADALKHLHQCFQVALIRFNGVCCGRLCDGNHELLELDPTGPTYDTTPRTLARL